MSRCPTYHIYTLTHTVTHDCNGHTLECSTIQSCVSQRIKHLTMIEGFIHSETQFYILILYDSGLGIFIVHVGREWVGGLVF